MARDGAHDRPVSILYPLADAALSHVLADGVGYVDRKARIDRLGRPCFDVMGYCKHGKECTFSHRVDFCADYRSKKKCDKAAQNGKCRFLHLDLPPEVDLSPSPRPTKRVYRATLMVPTWQARKAGLLQGMPYYGFPMNYRSRDYESFDRMTAARTHEHANDDHNDVVHAHPNLHAEPLPTGYTEPHPHLHAHLDHYANPHTHLYPHAPHGGTPIPADEGEFAAQTTRVHDPYTIPEPSRHQSHQHTQYQPQQRQFSLPQPPPPQRQAQLEPQPRSDLEFQSEPLYVHGQEQTQQPPVYHYYSNYLEYQQPYQPQHTEYNQPRRPGPRRSPKYVRNTVREWE